MSNQKLLMFFLSCAVWEMPTSFAVTQDGCRNFADIAQATNLMFSKKAMFNSAFHDFAMLSFALGDEDKGLYNTALDSAKEAARPLVDNPEVSQDQLAEYLDTRLKALVRSHISQAAYRHLYVETTPMSQGWWEIRKALEQSGKTLKVWSEKNARLIIDSLGTSAQIDITLNVPHQTPEYQRLYQRVTDLGIPTLSTTQLIELHKSTQRDLYKKKPATPQAAAPSPRHYASVEEGLTHWKKLLEVLINESAEKSDRQPISNLISQYAKPQLETQLSRKFDPNLDSGRLDSIHHKAIGSAYSELGYTVLHVEDEDLHLISWRDAFAKNGIKVAQAQNLRAAEVFLRSLIPDRTVVFLDGTLGMDKVLPGLALQFKSFGFTKIYTASTADSWVLDLKESDFPTVNKSHSLAKDKYLADPPAPHRSP